jgi:hypothetical protein
MLNVNNNIPDRGTDTNVLTDFLAMSLFERILLSILFLMLLIFLFPWFIGLIR